MPRLVSQLNHEEFKLKSELHIKNWKKRSSAENQATLAILQGLQNFTTLVKFCNPCEISQPVNLAAPVDFFCTLFYLFQICPYVIVFLF